MSRNDSGSNSSGIGFFGLLQVAFIVLKLCNVITWSWWAVFIPLWIELGIIVIILLLLIAANK